MENARLLLPLPYATGGIDAQGGGEPHAEYPDIDLRVNGQGYVRKTARRIRGFRPEAQAPIPYSSASSALLLAASGIWRCSRRSKAQSWRKTAGIRRMSVNQNVPQQRWAAQRQAGSDGDTRLAMGYIIYDGRCNRARRGADPTVVVAPKGTTSGSGPRQDAAGTLLLSVHDRSSLSSCRAKSAGSVSRSESRTTKP